MIDCGVFLNTPGEPARMRAVAEDIHKDTNGKIDLLIVMHEHWDHIAGSPTPTTSSSSSSRSARSGSPGPRTPTTPTPAR